MDSFYSEDGHLTRQNCVSWSMEWHRVRGVSLGWHLLIAPHDTPSAVYPNTAASTSKEELWWTEDNRAQWLKFRQDPLPDVAEVQEPAKVVLLSFLASGRCLALAVTLQAGNIRQQTPALWEVLVECLEHPKQMSPQPYPSSITTRIRN